MHCHLVFGVDDGAKTLDDSLTLLAKEYKDGARGIIITPHFRKGMFEAPRDKVEEHFNILKEEAAKKWPDLALYLGCEYHAHMDMTDDLDDARYRMAGSRYVLTEFSESHQAAYIMDRLYKVLSAGYIPIVAHAERYEAVYGHMDFIDEIRDRGALIQINADSILGHEGWGMKRFCKKLIANDFLDFVGSDAHNMKDRPCRIGECADFLAKKYGPDYMARIMIENPEALL